MNSVETKPIDFDLGKLGDEGIKSNGYEIYEGLDGVLDKDRYQNIMARLEVRPDSTFVINQPDYGKRQVNGINECSELGLDQFQDYNRIISLYNILRDDKIREGGTKDGAPMCDSQVLAEALKMLGHGGSVQTMREYYSSIPFDYAKTAETKDTIQDTTKDSTQVEVPGVILNIPKKRYDKAA